MDKVVSKRLRVVTCKDTYDNVTSPDRVFEDSISNIGRVHSTRAIGSDSLHDRLVDVVG